MEQAGCTPSLAWEECRWNRRWPGGGDEEEEEVVVVVVVEEDEEDCDVS